MQPGPQRTTRPPQASLPGEVRPARRSVRPARRRRRPEVLRSVLAVPRQAVVLAVVLSFAVVAASCSPADREPVAGAETGGSSVGADTDGAGTDGADGAEADGAAPAAENVAASFRQRIGSGRAVAAATGGSTTLVATTIGAEIVDADGTRTTVPTTSLEPAARVAIGADGAVGIVARSSTSEVWALGDEPSLLATVPGSQWEAVLGDGRAVLVSWTDVTIVDTADGSELDRIAIPADRTAGVATATPDGSRWAVELVGGPTPEVLLGGAEGAAPLVIDDTAGALIDRIQADPTSTRFLAAVVDPVLVAEPALVAIDAATGGRDWSVPLTIDDRWAVGSTGEVLVVGADGSRLIGVDGSVTIVDDAPLGPVAPVDVGALTTEGFVTLFDDGRRLVHGSDGRVVRETAAGTRPVAPLPNPVVSPGATLLDQVGLVDVIDGPEAVVRTIDAFVSGRVTGLDVADDGALAIATSAGQVRVLDDLGADGSSSEVVSFDHPEGLVDAVAFTPGTDRLVTGVAQRTGSLSFDDSVVVWDRSGAELQRFGGGSEDVAGCSSFVNPVTVAADGSFAVGVSHDFSLYVLDGDDLSTVRELPPHRAPILDIALSPSGDRLVSSAEDLTLRVVDVASGDVVAEYPTDLGGIRTVSFLPSGDQVLVGNLLGELRILDLDTGQITRTLDAAVSRDAIPEISPDGRLVAAGDGSTVRLWSLETGRVVGELGGHSGEVNTVVFSPDGAALVSGSTDGTAIVWDLQA